MLALAVAVALALPQQGLLVPGRSLAGVELGATEQQVRRSWGPHVGLCRGCPRRTLYFTRARFQESGVAVEFAGGRATALYTVWMPAGWRTSDGLRLGAPELEVRNVYRGTLRTECGHYSALSLRRGRVVTALWIRDGSLWAFGIQRPSAPLCR